MPSVHLAVLSAQVAPVLHATMPLVMRRSQADGTQRSKLQLQFQLQFTAVQEVHAGPAKGVGPGWTALNGHDLGC